VSEVAALAVPIIWLVAVLRTQFLICKLFYPDIEIPLSLCSRSVSTRFKWFVGNRDGRLTIVFIELCMHTLNLINVRRTWLYFRCLVNSHQTISHQSQLTPFLVNSPYIWNKEGLLGGGLMVFSTFCVTGQWVFGTYFGTTIGRICLIDY